MGLFSRKKEVEVSKEEQVKELYKSVNQIISNANNEADITIKVSQLQLANQKYEDLLVLIDQGADFDKEHFSKLKASLEKDIRLYQGLANEN